MHARLEIGDTPRFITNNAGVRAPQVEALAHEADWHFQLGRDLYRQGDEAGARREFDRAIDLLLSAPETPESRVVIDKKLEDMATAIHRLDLEGLGSGDLFAGPVFEKPPLEDMPELTFPVDPKLKDKVLEEVRATTSQLPLPVNDTVLSYVNYFTSDRGRKVLVSGLKRAGKYRALIQRIFDEEGVPQELIFLAQAESGFYPRAVSRASAMGMWQFGAGTARLYGLSQSRYSDDRFDPEKATRAAARYLRDLYHRYGDWFLAMAAYNCGPGAVDKAVERTGYADFWELRRRRVLPLDTIGYVPAIIATTIIVKNAKEYGLDNLETDPPLQYDTLDLSAPTHLQLVADLADTPLSELHDLNPAVLQNVAPDGAALRVPKGSATALKPVLESIPEEKRAAWRAHRLVAGETISMVARRYRVSESAIADANRESLEAAAPGDLLIIPVAPVVERVAAKRTHASKKASHRLTASKKSSGRLTAGKRASRAATSSSKRAASKRTSRAGTDTAQAISPRHGKRTTIRR